MTLSFHFEEFNGPMDLLVHLLEKNKIDVYDIPIATLTDQYLAYLHQAQSMNLEIASSFVLFAAKLIRIKAKMLLPGRPKPEEEGVDPRQELVDRILLYQVYKEAAQALEAKAQAEEDSYFRSHSPPLPDLISQMLPSHQSLDPGRLYQAFLEVFERAEEPDPLDLTQDVLTMADMVDRVLTALSAHQGVLTFTDLTQEAQGREEILALFLAMLECVRRDAIQLVQTQPFASIHIRQAS